MSYVLVTICCAFAALGSFLFGYDSGIISSSIAQGDFVQRFKGQLNDASTGGIVSAFTGKQAFCLYVHSVCSTFLTFSPFSIPLNVQTLGTSQNN